MTPNAPERRPGVATRLLSALLLLIVAGETLYRAANSPAHRPLVWRLIRRLQPALTDYGVARQLVLQHPILSGCALLVVAVAILLAYRACLVLWHNEILPRVSGTYFRRADETLPSIKVDVLREIARRPPETIFIGRQPMRRFGFWTSKPVYMTHRQKTMHRHVLGKTGSGKTLSVAFVGILQDLLDRKGLLDMSAKGSDEEIGIIKALAAVAGRQDQVRVLSLPAWNRPEIFSHTYNMVYVRPRTAADSGGDPAATAERVFSILPLGNEPYYNTQAEILFTNLTKLLHGIVDGDGNGIPFVMRDLAVCVHGAGTTGGFNQALAYCVQSSLDRDSARLIMSQIRSLGSEASKCFSGLRGAMSKFLSPLVNAYDPDIIFEEVLEKTLIVYVQLPANLFPIQAPAMGRVILQDVQQEGALRQVFRKKRNQNPFAVYLDEFYTFANVRIIDSLNKLRDAHVEYTLLHQSIADLEIVSREFASVVWDNTRTKDVLAQDNPDLCEKLAKSIGTHEIIEQTVRRQQGPLFTSLATGDASTKLVEAYKLHPNRIKNLATAGQGYLYNGEGIKPIVYGMLPADLVARYDLKQKDQSKARGLRLHEQFIEHLSAEAVAEAAAPTLGRACPLCGSALRLKVGKRGDFVACSAYPACGYTGNPNAKPSSRKCPKCSGPMEEIEVNSELHVQCVKRGCRARQVVRGAAVMTRISFTQERS